MQVSLVARCKVLVVFNISNNGILGSNPARGMDVYPRFLSCVGRGLAVGRSPVKRVLPKRLKEFIVSEVKFELEQARGPDP
jgi:hypothetical protein